MRLIVLLLGVACCVDAFADDNEELNDIYRAFMTSPVDVEHIESLYRDDVIHVGRNEAPLIQGVSDFMETNVTPMAEAINSGAATFKGRAYIVRRVITEDMANDVGYLHSSISYPDGRSGAVVQKFSWVFIRENGRWRVLTDFDGTRAPIDLLEELQPQFVVE